MPEAVSWDTSPLQSLHQLGHLALLPTCSHTVVIPPSVAQELAQGRALGVAVPAPAAFSWLQIRAPRPLREGLRTSPLGRGERDVLALALATPAALVRMDDGQARRLGQHLGLRLTGTVGVMLAAPVGVPVALPEAPGYASLDDRRYTGLACRRLPERPWHSQDAWKPG